MAKTNSKQNPHKPRPLKPVPSHRSGGKINEQRSHGCRKEGTGPRSPKK